jgi:hypothetical protein
MDAKQNQLVIAQDPDSPRKPYTLPELTRHGTVVELTRTPILTDGAVIGSGILTDTLTEIV